MHVYLVVSWLGAQSKSFWSGAIRGMLEGNTGTRNYKK